VEVDIRRFFDTIDHGHLRQFLERRVRDGVLLRLIGKWLNAGVLEDGRMTLPEEGSPQGGVISPLLANIFLHYVLDVWFEQEVQPRLKGRSFLIRYADDFVIGFTCEEDARRVMKVLPQRFEKFGLSLHPEKTRLVPFERPDDATDGTSSEPRTPPGTFDLLGFTHFWGRSSKGSWVVRRKTSSSRFRRGVKAISLWCRVNRHEPLSHQHQKLSQKLTGHFGYYGITGNSRSLGDFRTAVIEQWKRWLSRRRRSGWLSWDWMQRLQERYPLPLAIVVHSVYRRAART
jgi:group II intron reverse transcriptase/maturase